MVSKMIDLEELERLERSATPGLWWVIELKAKRTVLRARSRFDPKQTTIVAETYGDMLELAETEAEFIAAARNALPALIRELKAAREAVEMARKWNAAVEGEGRPDIARRDALRAIAAYDEATKQ